MFRKDMEKGSARAVPALSLRSLFGEFYGGFLTPTEAAAGAVIYTIPVGMGLQRLTMRPSR